MNGIDYSESDDCLIISGRNQCVVKVNRNNELVWILAPHKGWGKSGANGTGIETNPYLLTAVDASGQAYSLDIQNGDNRSIDFDWSWGQHAPVVLENGNLLLFDNGFKRQYTGAEVFSRAVEYEINESNNSIREVWSYGEVRGSECFSNIISNALKYSDSERTLEITVDAKKRYNRVVYTLRDTGKGIAQKYLDKIWDVFYRIQPRSDKTGEGIGLSLVK